LSALALALIGLQLHQQSRVSAELKQMLTAAKLPEASIDGQPLVARLSQDGRLTLFFHPEQPPEPTNLPGPET